MLPAAPAGNHWFLLHICEFAFALFIFLNLSLNFLLITRFCSSEGFLVFFKLLKIYLCIYSRLCWVSCRARVLSRCGSGGSSRLRGVGSGARGLARF